MNPFETTNPIMSANKLICSRSNSQNISLDNVQANFCLQFSQFSQFQTQILCDSYETTGL